MTEKLFFDTDCLSSFLWVGRTDILEAMYSGQIVFPDPVYLELSKPSIPHLKQRADAMIANGHASVQSIYADSEEYNLYYRLVHGLDGKIGIGQGEAACIALAKTTPGILASNNFRDVAFYVNEYGLRHTNTSDIMKEALRRGIITEAEGNQVWNGMLNKNRRLPTATFSEYLKKK